VDTIWTPEKKNDEALEIGAKIGYIYSGRKKA